MDLRFAAMETDTCSSSSTNGAALPSNTSAFSSSSFRDFLPPWSCTLPSQSPVSMVRPCQTLTSAGAWGYALVGQCFSRMHRVQFDEEHQRSLLSCHSTEGDDGAFPDEAMLELRRRVLKADGESQTRKPTFAKDLDLAYPVQTPLYLPQPRNPTSRWEKRKANALAMKLQAAASNSQQQQQVASGASNNKSATTNSTTSSAATRIPAQFKTLLSDTEKALDDILGAQPSNQQQQRPQADDVRRLSVDELLALRPASSSSLSTCSTSSSVGSMSPDKPSELDDEDDEDDNNLSPDAKLLRQWLADVDPPRAAEYHAYARCFEAQGFQALEDLAELDEHEVEQAMSEVGISKFAHRARLRKAILRLRSDSFQSEHSRALMTSD